VLYVSAMLFAAVVFMVWIFLGPELPPALGPVRASPTFVVVFCLLLAVAVSLVKRSHQLWYGIAEVVVAMVGAWRSIVVAPADQTTRLLVLAGAVYVMSRGVNNILDALAKRRAAEHATMNTVYTK
jgi:hypothetical protein